MQNFDIIVIGAGIAGASVGAHLAKLKRVCILEREERAGYHSTSRSAAMYVPNYGPPPMLAFTRASDGFFKDPPKGFADAPLVELRPTLYFMAEGQEDAAETMLSESVGLQELSETEALKVFPVLRPGYARRSLLDPNSADLDVDLLHRGYMKLFKASGGVTITNAEATSLTRRNGSWQIETPAGLFEAPVLVNAAGAWADAIAVAAGANPLEIAPKRRSIGVVPLPKQLDFSGCPMVGDVGETWYAKPQSGKLLVSSADATPVEPHDAYGDDMAIAEGIERMMNATTLEIDRLDHSWGGLRSFAPDGNPVIGFDPKIEGFFWLAGQGGYGIQSAPALSQTAAALVLGHAIPAHVIAAGLDQSHISPNRFSS
jgi:D-arginine dehydrogenase